MTNETMYRKKDILLSIRKKELVSALEDQLVEDAIQSGVFVQY